jgi:hypothetical protein
MDYQTVIGIHPWLSSLTLFIRDIKNTYGDEKIRITHEIASSEWRKTEQRFKFFGIDDPFGNLKANRNFIACF